jgi:hypothetical protein
MEDFDLENQLIQNRLRRFQSQGYEAPQGKMVGRNFIAPNVLQHIAAGLRGYGAIKGEQQATQELKDLRGKRQETEARDMSAFVSALRGTPAQASTTTPTQMPSFDEADAQSMQGVQGYGATTGAQAAIPGDPMAAYSLAAASQSPTLRQVGMKGIADTSQRQADLARQQQQLQVLKNAENPQAAIAAGVDPALVKNYYESQNIGKEKGVVVNGQLVNPVTGAPIGQAIPKQATPTQPNLASDLLIPDGKGGFIPNAALINAKSQVAAAGRAPAAAQSPYFQPVQTAQGVMAFNARTGRVEPVMGANGQPVVGAQFDPALQGNLAASKASATTTAKSEAEATFEAPKVVAEADEAVRLVDDLLKAPGFKQAVGASRMLGVQKIPGTAARDFDIRLDQLQGKQFLQAFESLKGGGQITEIEGKKATDAIARMNASGSEAEFTKAAKEFQDVIRTGADRARKRIPAGQQSSAPAQKTVVRTGTANGRKVVQYSDGTTAYAD